MSRGDDVGKLLGSWVGKAKKIADPPTPKETTGALKRPEPIVSLDEGEPAQLNFKVSLMMKRRVKQLAVRDNITLLAMFAEMVELYEREHGKLGK